jgi:hypothetical protein
MASKERTGSLLERTGFGSVGTEQVPVRFAFRNLDAYEQWMIDVGASFGMVGADSPRMSASCSGGGSRRRSPPSPYGGVVTQSLGWSASARLVRPKRTLLNCAVRDHECG